MKTDLELLKEANEVLRSCYAVALRDGESTRWPELRNKIKETLAEQHWRIYPQEPGL